MKKFVSILLVFAMLAGVASLSVTAETEDYSVYPESEHDYQNDCYYKKWTYVHPEEAEGLFVTFSEDTYFEPWSMNEETGFYKAGDSLFITMPYYEQFEIDIGSFTGDELASKTVYIPGSSFSVYLDTDSSVTAYGFKIDSIETAEPENADAICYNFGPNVLGVEKYYEFYDVGETVAVADNLSYQISDGSCRFSQGNKYRCGWATEPDGELVYDDGAEITPEGGIVNLYAAYTPIIVGADDVFYFQNRDYIFNNGDFSEGAQSYYMTPEDHDMLLRNALRLGLPGLFFYDELKNYPHRGFEGSCFGMACSVFLQYYGMIDMLSLQEGAKTVRELKPSAEVVSTINYYQSLTLLSYLCSNQGYGVGSDEYKKQLKSLYDTVAGGKPVIMSLLTDERFIFGTAHTVLVTGAYTDTKGNHYLIVYEGQSGYAQSDITVLRVAPDFSSFSSRYGNAFYWIAENSLFEAYDMDGQASPFSWYREFIPHIGGLLKMLFSYLSVLLNK